MFITGNHDTLRQHETGYDWKEQLSQKEVYDLYFAPYIQNWKVEYKEVCLFPIQCFPFLFKPDWIVSMGPSFYHGMDAQ